MPSSAFDEKAAAPLKSRARAKVDLIAWDPESPEHIERMFQQRIACGWKADLVQKWRGLQREGKMAIQWVVSFVLLLVDHGGCITLGKGISFALILFPKPPVKTAAYI